MEKTKQIIKKLPLRKPHLDFLAAMLTIPVLITVLVINLSNLESRKSSVTPTPTATPVAQTKQTLQAGESPQTKIITIQVTPTAATVTPSPTPNPDTCIKGIGPIDITYPQENQTVSDNPLCISINYTQGNYCSVVWAYKINNGNFSNYSNNSVCLYNVPQGSNTFTLEVKSLVNSDTKAIIRDFEYVTNTQVTQTPTPVASSSASSH